MGLTDKSVDACMYNFSCIEKLYIQALSSLSIFNFKLLPFYYTPFFLKMLWFLLQPWCSTCLVCVHTLTPSENRERQESGIFKNLCKETQYLMNTLYFIEVCLALTGFNRFEQLITVFIAHNSTANLQK